MTEQPEQKWIERATPLIVCPLPLATATEEQLAALMERLNVQAFVALLAQHDTNGQQKTEGAA